MAERKWREGSEVQTGIWRLLTEIAKSDKDAESKQQQRAIAEKQKEGRANWLDKRSTEREKGNQQNSFTYSSFASHINTNANVCTTIYHDIFLIVSQINTHMA